MQSDLSCDSVMPWTLCDKMAVLKRERQSQILFYYNSGDRYICWKLEILILWVH